MNKLAAVTVLGMITATNVLALCDFGSSTFDSVNGCIGYTCAWPCGVTSSGPDQYLCYQGMDSCCGCRYYYSQCEGAFYCGQALTATRIDDHNLICNNHTHKCDPIPQ